MQLCNGNRIKAAKANELQSKYTQCQLPTALCPHIQTHTLPHIHPHGQKHINTDMVWVHGGFDAVDAAAPQEEFSHIRTHNKRQSPCMRVCLCVCGVILFHISATKNKN